VVVVVVVVFVVIVALGNSWRMMMVEALVFIEPDVSQCSSSCWVCVVDANWVCLARRSHEVR